MTRKLDECYTDEEAERREVCPGRHVLLEGVDLALAARPLEDVRAVDVDEVQQAEHLAAVVDLLRGDTRDAPLVVDRRRAERPVVDVDVRAADLAGVGFGLGYAAVYLGIGEAAFDYILEYARTKVLPPATNPIAML